MKKWIILFAVALFAGCSDDENKAGGADPFLPVSGLEIPTQQLAGGEITILGKGFDKECSIVLQLNGGEQFDTEIVEVATDRVVFRTADLQAGFYIVILKQNDKTYRIGGMNLYKEGLEPEDIEAYGVGSDNGLALYPVSVSKKTKGERLVTIGAAEYDYYGGLVIGQVYYYATYAIRWSDASGFLRSHREFNVGSYDFATGEQRLLFENIRGFVAMGNIDGKFCVIRSDGDLYSLQQQQADDSFTELISCPAGGGELITVNDGIFVYDPVADAIVMGVYDMSKDTQKIAWRLHLNDRELATIGGTSDILYHFVDCGGNIYATAERVLDQDAEESEAYIFRLANPTDWQFSTVPLLNTFKNTSFSAPCYHSSKGVIYGMDENETVVTYDVQKNQFVGGKWVNSGLYGLFVLND